MTYLPQTKWCSVGIVFAGLSLMGVGSVHAGVTATDLFALPFVYVDPAEDMYPNAANGQLVGRGSQSNDMVWSVAQPAGVDLTPTGSPYSVVYGTDGSRQVGYSYTPAVPAHQAAVWSGSVASYVGLNPVGIQKSEAIGIGGGQIVGWGTDDLTPWRRQAMIFNAPGTAPTVLGSQELIESSAIATDGIHQVGYGSLPGIDTAMLWTGTAESRVDLNADWMLASKAIGLSGNQQVGIAYVGLFDAHAVVWSGTAQSAVDLNPADYSESYAYGTNGQYQVGFGQGDITNNRNHALLWSGSAESVVDLHAALQGEYFWSKALSITDNTVYGIASGIDGIHFVSWDVSNVPEPAGLSVLMIGGLILGRPRRR